jgi:hypothetical protein
MRKFIYIVFAAALFATSCEQEQTVVDNGEWPIHYGYMQFSTEVSTRAQLVTDMKGKSFGVLGYQYSPTTNWATAKPVTAPMADFYNLVVSCASNNGNCSYDAFPSDGSKDLKEWEESNYSFFAYYPKDGAGITLSKNTDTNTPTLTYTYPWLNGSGKDWLKNEHKTVDTQGKDVILNNVVRLYHKDVPVYDLMTAQAVDVNGRGSGKVGLDFKHRMFALEVLANNYNENEYEVDENGDYVLDENGNKKITKSARQTIKGLVLTLDNLQHSTMTIPMSMQDSVEDHDSSCTCVKPSTFYALDGTQIEGKCSFLICDKTVMIPAFNETYEGRGGGVPTSISKLGSNNGGYLMLIPQSVGLKGMLLWDTLSNFSGNVSTEFSSPIKFEAGRLYQLYINYAGDGITIALIEAGAWDVFDVEHKFE